MKFTKTAIEALACPVGRKDAMFFDDQEKGLAVRVAPDRAAKDGRRLPGAKIFLFQYRSGGAVRRKVLGEFGVLTVAQAREAALQLRARVAHGEDPVGQDIAARRGKADGAAGLGATLGELVDAWGAAKLKSGDRRPEPLKTAVSSLKFHLGDWWDRPVHSITSDDVAARIGSIAERSVPAALNPYRHGRALFAWAIGARQVKVSPFADLAPPGKDRKRDRVLSDTELAELWQAATLTGHPWGDWTRMLMLTLQRVEQVAGMRWSEVSADLTLWTIPAERSKNGKPHFVHLTPAAQAILRHAPRRPGCDLVFTTNGKTQMTAWSKLSHGLKRGIVERRAAEAAQAGAPAPSLEPPDWVFHDLRRNGVTAMAALGVPPHVADRVLSHAGKTISGVARIYQQYEFLDERQRAMLLWEQYILTVAAGRNPIAELKRRGPAEVITLAAARGPGRDAP